MISQVTIRKANERDFQFIYEFVNQLESCIFPEEQQEIYLKEILRNFNNIYLIAEINECPVGFLSCHVQFLLHHGGLIGEIQEMYVKPDYRSLGIGKKLIDELRAVAKEKGTMAIEVTSNIKREYAHSFYEREGFIFSHKKFTLSLE